MMTCLGYSSTLSLVHVHFKGMKCVITYTASTEGEDFYGEGADAKVPDLGSRKVTLDSIFGPLRKDGLNAELLAGIKDPQLAPVTDS